MFYYNIDMNLRSRMGECDYIFFFCDLVPTVYFGVYLHENLFKRNDAIWLYLCDREMENCILCKRALEI